MADERAMTSQIKWDYDKENDVLYVLRADAKSPTWNYDTSSNMTVRVDMETLSVVGLVINNFSVAEPVIYKRLMDKAQAPYMVSQLAIVLKNLSEKIRGKWAQYLSQESSKSEVEEVLKTSLACR